MSQKKNKKPADTLKEFFDSLVQHAKLNAAAGKDVAEVSREVDQVRAAIGEEMKGKTPADATPLAYRLRGKAEGYGHVAALVAAMVKRLEVRKNETVH